MRTCANSMVIVVSAIHMMAASMACMIISSFYGLYITCQCMGITRSEPYIDRVKNYVKFTEQCCIAPKINKGSCSYEILNIQQLLMSGLVAYIKSFSQQIITVTLNVIGNLLWCYVSKCAITVLRIISNTCTVSLHLALCIAAGIPSD
ncbi:hypothetical protein MHIR_DE00185 [Candidatus Doolittlea endobia]|uniref:Uncharacterized protein n=1 Tax=Candidatus Doolittlea endobia TaxID=1778262 RepID=A0A143WS54_9ENTR|nr:hypothetical protein MHIR_DE00185 [Candidatus Doolittlea endobia]